MVHPTLTQYPDYVKHNKTSLATSLNNTPIVSLQVEGDMLKPFHDGGSGSLVKFLCPGIQTRLKENCLANTLIDLRRLSTVFEFAVSDFRVLNAARLYDKI